MSQVHLAQVARHIRRLAAAPALHDSSDGRLLRQFHARQDQAAFALLVERHGPLVLRVCRHVLGHEHDAEDAFQATFLVLARRAASIRKPEALGAWLHGVARRISMQARRNAARRRAHERQVETVAAAKPAADLGWREVQAVLDEEIGRLPETYRTPFVLCVLEGQGRAEVARRLGLKEGTVWSRLAEARKRLQARLLRRGIELGAALAAAHLAENAGQAAVPVSLKMATVQAVAGMTASVPTALSADVALLVEGCLKSVLPFKGKIGVALLLAACVIGAGSGALISMMGQADLQGIKDDAHTTPVVAQKAEAPQQRNSRADIHGDPLPEAALARLGTVRFRQGSSITAVRFSRDGKTVLLGGGGRAAGLWDALTGKGIRQFGPLSHGITDAVLSPDGTMLATATIGVVLWDSGTGKRLKDLEQNEFVGCLVFSSDGKTLATGTQQGVNLWEVSAGKKTRSLKHGAQVRGLAFCGDGKFVVSAGEDGTVRSWDAATGAELRRWETQKGLFHAFAAAPAGSLCAHGGGDRALRLFDCVSGKETQLMKSDPLVFKIRDPATGKETSFSQPVPFGALAFAPDGKELASAHSDGTVRLWNTATGKETSRWQTPTTLVYSLAYTADAKALVLSGHYSGLQWWDKATGKEIPPPCAGHDGRIEALAFARDGQELISRGADGTVFRWDVPTGRERSSFRLFHSAAAAFSPNRDRVVSIDGGPNQKFGDPVALRLRETVTGKELRTLATISPGNKITFSPDGKSLAVAGWDLMRRSPFISVRDAQTGKQRHRFEKKEQRGFFCVAFSPDNKKLAAGGWDAERPNFRLWDLDTGRQLTSCDPDHWVNSITFSPDGKLVALGSGGDFKSCVTVWDLASAVQVRKFAHPGSDYVAAFSPSGRFVASGATMGSLTNLPTPDHNLVRVWEIASGQQVAAFAGHHSGVSALAFAADGKSLASGGGDSTILIWDLIGSLRGGAPRRLNQKELEARWADPAGADAARAYTAIGDMVRSGDAAVACLKTHLAPVPLPDAAVIRRAGELVKDLNSDTFAVRQKATAELEKLGGAAVSALRKTLAQRPSLEMQRRIEKILAGFAGKEAPFYLRWSRALEVLELIATPAARDLIQSLGQGDAEAWLTREALAAARRREFR